ncbi:PadR family transcriptional regulator [Kineococcus sp. SYSU DK006]|uniref:PadR family transcriptional regulator n=1 Tax=Kineococcus sp. SYSU DK006 TaxID=3383127 RepID=UPI003D7CF20F
MARTPQTQLAVLGALSIEPMTGYRLRAEIVQTLGHFWHESFGQVYPALSALQAEGLVERAEAGGGSGTPFRITAAGRRRLRELLGEPFQQPPPRDQLLLRLFFGDQVPADLVRRWLTEALTGAEEDRARYERLRTELEAEAAAEAAAGGARGARFRLVTVLAGLHGAQARVRWAQEALALLEEGGAPAAGPAGTA